MPLSETNNKQSQSIEDLIAELDAPVKTDCQSEAGCAEPRKVIKGKRSGQNVSFGKNQSFGNNSEPILAKNIIMSKKYSTHTKRSLNNRGQPKKGGAGGKGVWGAPGCELDAEYLDTKDPNYDSDQESENVVMVCVDNSEPEKKNQKKVLETSDFESEIKLIILEYFQNGDTFEVIDTLKCLNFSKVKPELIAYVISIALENNNTCKELMSRLLRDLKLEIFAGIEFESGFDILLKNLDDLSLDNPDAPEKTGTFIARAIADKVLSKKYLTKEFAMNDEKTKKAIESAKLLININDHLFQLSHIWGNKGGFLAVKELSDKINELIVEYYDSGDIEEAIRCLKELNVPHFHHEFVYESLDFALQKANDHAINLITNLLEKLCKSAIITYDQLKIGFIRIFDLLPDISLDVPNVNALMDTILSQSHSKGFIPESLMDLAPNKSRKRFVSEGDGGRIKDENTN